ncbi:MAG: hypothetical protein K8S18_03040 [Desulfobacula sp.]|nr:hypothetical protein [Desulfobacula sp.]
MPRNMSFMLTTQQVYDKTKTHTIRDSWWFLNPGDIVNTVEKGQGLKKGEKIVQINQIRIISTREAMLLNVTPELCIMEGFPDLTPIEFADMFCRHNRKASLTKPLNFIHFGYV